MSEWITILALGGALAGGLVWLAGVSATQHNAQSMLRQYHELLRSAREEQHTTASRNRANGGPSEPSGDDD